MPGSLDITRFAAPGPGNKKRQTRRKTVMSADWLRGRDLNPRPPGYEAQSNRPLQNFFTLFSPSRYALIPMRSNLPEAISHVKLAHTYLRVFNLVANG